METTNGESGMQDQKPQEKRSSGARLSTLFDVGIRSTGQFEVATKSEAMSFREACLMFLSMFINSVPCVILGTLFAAWQSYVVRTGANAVLDVLEDQPAGWAAEGFDYKAYKASSYLGYAKRLPPGPGPFNGTNATYGGRADWGAEWGDVPSIEFRNLYSGYFSAGLMGHPMVDDGYFWLARSILFLSRIGMLSISAGLVNTLYSSKLKGKYAHLLLHVYGVLVAFLMDYYMTWMVLHSGRPVGDQGTLYANGVLMWWLYHTYLMWSTVKYGYKLMGAGRCVALPIATVVILSIVLNVIVWDLLINLQGKALLVIRLVVWPLLTELVLAPCRAALRGISDDWVDKAGLAFAMIPPIICLSTLGRLFQYKIIDPTDMIVCNFVLFGLELAFRLSVAHRDRFYARMLGCMSAMDVKHLFTQRSNVKFRCDNLVNEMVIEYWSMFVMFFQAFLLNRMADPGAPSNKGILLANFFLQFFLELICDTVCLYVEDTKLKAPVVKAWMGRKQHYPLILAAIVMSTGMYSMTGPLYSVCPMRHPETGSFMGITCTLNE
jgi:hypothetical protein